jgi:hypothetical protein
MAEPILVFYDGYERRALPGLAGQIRSQTRRVARLAWRTLQRKQTRTGFYTAFLALTHSLRQAGYEVKVNDFAAALRSPTTPIGVAGYPSVLEAVAGLPNPRVFGPGDFGLPPESATVAADARNRILSQPSEWFAELYRPYCGEKTRPWFVGIDTNLLKPPAAPVKEIDFVVYDKIRWDRDRHQPGIIARLAALLEARGHSAQWLRYGAHHQETFFSACVRAKAMIFLCEHETQGIAYQEAMALGLPILAWNEGVLIDPVLAPYVTQEARVSSVPYFDETCGRTFTQANLDGVLDEFWRDLPRFTPRDYVRKSLSPAESASRWIGFWEEAARSA